MADYEYVVISLAELVKWPSLLSTRGTKIKEIASSLTQGLNKKASQGWELVTIYATMGTGFAVFKKKNSG